MLHLKESGICMIYICLDHLIGVGSLPEAGISPLLLAMQYYMVCWQKSCM